ncbi:MAG TPA: alginate export family protein [Bryobacteraceae bacterium]|nr:alginate export family protein [Bryobacteraceae bacterium]
MSRVLVTSAIALATLLCQDAFPQSSNSTGINLYPPDTPGESHASMDLRIPGPNPDGWLYPITQLDQSLPPWIQFGGQFRDRVESQDGLSYGYTGDTYDLTQLRIGMYLQPTKWLELVAVTQDSRVFFNHHVATGPSYQNIWDIREAYIELGSSTEGWFDLIAGREIFSFGDERVIGPSDWVNMGRTFDTVRMDLHPPGVSVSIFAASVINAIDGQIDHHIEGNNLYGVYSSFSRIIPHATLEPYLLWRVAPGNVSLPETEHRGHFSEVTGGARLAGTAWKAVDYDIEMNKQTGSLGHDTIDAWGGHWNAGYTFHDAHGKPRIFSEYNYASGNKSPNGNTWSTHDELYPSAHDKMEFADQFGWRNIEDLRIGVDETISKRWGLTQVFNDLWLASKNDAVYNSSGAISIAADPRATSKHLGAELDLIARYKQNQHVTYGFGFAHIFTGAFINQATPGKDYNYPYAYVTYIF